MHSPVNCKSLLATVQKVLVGIGLLMLVICYGMVEPTQTVLADQSASTDQSSRVGPKPTLQITGDSAELKYNLMSHLNGEMFGKSLTRDIYETAKSHPELQEIKAYISYSPSGGFVDKYGNHVSDTQDISYFAQDKLDEVRKYVNADSFERNRGPIIRSSIWNDTQRFDEQPLDWRWKYGVAPGEGQ